MKLLVFALCTMMFAVVYVSLGLGILWLELALLGAEAQGIFVFMYVVVSVVPCVVKWTGV